MAGRVATGWVTKKDKKKKKEKDDNENLLETLIEKLDFDDDDLIKLHSQANGTLINYIRRKTPIIFYGEYPREILAWNGDMYVNVDGDNYDYCVATYLSEG